MATILCAQSEVDVSRIVESAVSQDDHTLIPTSNVDNLMQQVRRQIPDLIILDEKMLYHNGYSVCHQLRTIPRLAQTPILVLTNAQTAQDVAQVLDAGYDDCVRSSIAERELAARIRALLRRKHRPIHRVQLALNPKHKTVDLHGREVNLTPTEYDLLETLCQFPGHHFTTSALLEAVWHYPPGSGDPALVRNHVRNLRRKLEADPDHPCIVMCFQGRGYTISAEVLQN